MTMLKDHIDVRVARTMQDLLEVVSLRAMVFVEEQRCPLHEEFDGNDYAGATHLIASVHGEPCGVVRLRWFGSFVKLERVAVRRMYRGNGVCGALMAEGYRLSAKKGFRLMLAYIEPALLAFYVKHGFQQRMGRRAHHISDREYIEVEMDLDESLDSLDVNSLPLILLRPEGAWDTPGVLDRSSLRAMSSEPESAIGVSADASCLDALPPKTIAGI